MIPALMPVYPRCELSIERGEGVYLHTTDGRRILDMCSGIAVSCLGHAHPSMVAALTAQAGKVWHTSNVVRIPEGEALAERLAAASFADTMFFTNSGAEAWECGVKLVRKYHSHHGNPQRWRVITMDGCFHGRTMAGISASPKPKMVDGFGPLMEGFDQVPFNDINALAAAITPQTAAVCLEPVMGEGGVQPASLDYLREVRALCDEAGILLFLDEIQCGMGRTGKLFAHEWAGITPDVMCVAKGIGGGFPLGACMATEAAAAGMVFGTHGSTYGGNPLAMAVGHAVLDVMLAPGFLDGVDHVARLFWNRLKALQQRHARVITDVRGAGLMLGVRLDERFPVTEFLPRLRQRDVLAVGAGENVVRLLPPLIIGPEHVDQAITALDAVITQMVEAVAEPA